MEFVVEKNIDGEWYYEGKGNLDYVNRVIAYFVNDSTVLRIKVAE